MPGKEKGREALRPLHAEVAKLCRKGSPLSYWSTGQQCVVLAPAVLPLVNQDHTPLLRTVHFSQVLLQLSRKNCYGISYNKNGPSEEFIYA